MPKKKLYLIIGVTAIITTGFFLAAYIISQQETGGVAGEPSNPFGNFFPFGKGGSGGDTDGGNSSPSDQNPAIDGVGGTGNDLLNNQDVLSSLRQISSTPTAGLSPSVRSGKTAVLFVERATGNIFETTMETMRRDRISNAILPKIQEVFFGNNNKSAVYRSIQDGGSSITTFVRTVPNPDRSRLAGGDATTTNTIDGSYLEENISNILISPDAKNMFYLTKTPDFNTRVTSGNILNFQKNTSALVFQSPFSEWLPVAFDGKTVLLQTKASQNVPGFLYSVSLPSGEPKKVLGGINGLTALPSPNMQKILYSESTRGGTALHLLDRKAKTTTDIPIQTLSEKCVWNTDSTSVYCAAPNYLPSAEYPDMWYQGNVAFSDTMWKIDAKTGDLSAIFLPEDFGATNMDMINLALSPSSDFIFFINKTDSTLWGFDLMN